MDYYVDDIWIDVVTEEDHERTAEVTDDVVEDGSVISDHVITRPRTVTIRGVVTNHPTRVPLSHAGGVTSALSAPQIEADPPPAHREQTFVVEGEPANVTALPFVPNGILGISLTQPERIAGTFGISPPPRRFRLTGRGQPSSDRGQLFSLDALAFSAPFDRVAEVDRALEETFLKKRTVKLLLTGGTLSSMIITRISHKVSARDGGKDALRFSLTAKQIETAASQHGDIPIPLDPVKAKAKTSGPKPTEADSNPADQESFLYHLLQGGQ